MPPRRDLPTPTPSATPRTRRRGAGGRVCRRPPPTLRRPSIRWRRSASCSRRLSNSSSAPRACVSATTRRSPSMGSSMPAVSMSSTDAHRRASLPVELAALLVESLPIGVDSDAFVAQHARALVGPHRQGLPFAHQPGVRAHRWVQRGHPIAGCRELLAGHAALVERPPRAPRRPRPARPRPQRRLHPPRRRSSPSRSASAIAAVSSASTGTSTISACAAESRVARSSSSRRQPGDAIPRRRRLLDGVDVLGIAAVCRRRRGRRARRVDGVRDGRLQALRFHPLLSQHVERCDVGQLARRAAPAPWFAPSRPRRPRGGAPLPGPGGRSPPFAPVTRPRPSLSARCSSSSRWWAGSSRTSCRHSGQGSPTASKPA